MIFIVLQKPSSLNMRPNSSRRMEFASTFRISKPLSSNSLRHSETVRGRAFTLITCGTQNPFAYPCQRPMSGFVFNSAARPDKYRLNCLHEA